MIHFVQPKSCNHSQQHTIMYLVLVNNLLQCRQEHLIRKLRVRAVVGIVLQVERVEPLPEAVV